VAGIDVFQAQLISEVVLYQLIVDVFVQDCEYWNNIPVTV